RSTWPCGRPSPSALARRCFQCWRSPPGMNLSRVDDPRSGEADKPGDEIEHDADDAADDKAAGDAPDAVDQPEDRQDVEVEDAPSAGGDGPHDRYEDADHADDDRRPGADDLRSEP